MKLNNEYTPKKEDHISVVKNEIISQSGFPLGISPATAAILGMSIPNPLLDTKIQELKSSITSNKRI